jgi:hypothetical protein
MIMQVLTVSKAKATFSGVARRVIRTKKPVTVRTPLGFVQIVPLDVPEYVPPSESGDFEFSTEAIRLANTFGETL